jgi:hypothetical protein
MLLLVFSQLHYPVQLEIVLLHLLQECRLMNDSPQTKLLIHDTCRAASIFGGILPGFIANHIGHFNVMVFIAFLSGFLILAYWLPKSPFTHPLVLLSDFAVFHGLASSEFVSLMTHCVVVLWDGKVEQLGPELGAFMFVIAIAYVLIGANFVADSYFRALAGLPILGAIAESVSIGSKASLPLPVLS